MTSDYMSMCNVSVHTQYITNDYIPILIFSVHTQYNSIKHDKCHKDQKTIVREISKYAKLEKNEICYKVDDDVKSTITSMNSFEKSPKDQRLKKREAGVHKIEKSHSFLTATLSTHFMNQGSSFLNVTERMKRNMKIYLGIENHKRISRSKIGCSTKDTETILDLFYLSPSEGKDTRNCGSNIHIPCR